MGKVRKKREEKRYVPKVRFETTWFLPEKPQVAVLSDGTELRKGEFVWLDNDLEVLVAGPYRYEGFSLGSHIFSVGEGCFLSHVGLLPQVRRLDWKRWRNLRLYEERFQEHVKRWNARCFMERAA